MTGPGGDAGGQIVRDGFAMARLSSSSGAALASLATEAARFFRRDEAFKSTYASADFLHGFRPMGRQYSGQIDTIDLNESVVLRGGSFTGWPRTDGIEDLRDALQDVWLTGTQIVAVILDQMRDALGGSTIPDVIPHSYIEVNWYHRSPDRELLQERHEDGHLLTVAHSTEDGLEVEGDDGWRPVYFDGRHVALMAGSLLGVVTGGRAPAAYHRVRQVPFDERVSILMLVDPVVDDDLVGFVGDVALDRAAAIEHIRTIGHQFGLPDAPVGDRAG